MIGNEGQGFFIFAALFFILYGIGISVVIFQQIQSRARSRRRAMAVKLLGNNGVNMQIKDNGSGTFTLTPEDAQGNKTNLAAGAAVSWAIGDDTLASLTPSADGLSCSVSAKGPLGKTQVQASIPAVGSEPALQASGDLEVVAGDATQIVMTGTPN